MKRTAAMCALTLGLVACSGNPFTEETTEGEAQEPATTASGVPAAILNDVERISFNAEDNTLTVTGLTQDGVPLVNNYTAVADTFVPGYSTFTGQNDPLGRHATAFVASREGGLQAGVVMTGGQFNQFFGGTFFERTGEYQPPTGPDAAFDVTYHGTYAAGLNFPGQVTDLLPTDGLDPDVNTPNQTAYIQGLIFVNVDFNDMSVEGEVFDRTAVFGDPDDPTQALFGDLPDLVLVEGALAGDGTFAGNIEIDASDPIDSAPDNPVGNDIGDFAGVIGGENSNALAGGTNIENFTEDLDNEIEFGVFVLDVCTSEDTTPICTNAQQP